MTPQYLAGFIDADGCIVIGQGNVNIRVCQKNVTLLKKIQKHFGGTISCTNSTRGVHNLRWYGDDAIKLGNIVAPYLILKRKELDIMYKYADTRGVRGKHTSECTKAARKNLEQQMKDARNTRLDAELIVKEADL